MLCVTWPSERRENESCHPSEWFSSLLSIEYFMRRLKTQNGLCIRCTNSEHFFSCFFPLSLTFRVNRVCFFFFDNEENTHNFHVEIATLWKVGCGHIKRPCKLSLPSFFFARFSTIFISIDLLRAVILSSSLLQTVYFFNVQPSAHHSMYGMK